MMNASASAAMSVRWKNPPDYTDSEDENEETGIGSYREYEETLMYGRYTKSLGQYAREEAEKLHREEAAADEAAGLKPYRGRVATKCFGVLSAFWRHTFGRGGEEWLFLITLGVLMALVSFVMDYGIYACLNARMWLYRDLTDHVALKYLAWISFPVCLVLFSAGIVHLISPQAAGSGIPEMKTILRGVVLKEYLTFRTLVAKLIGLTATLGANMPLGKEGPFVHVGSIVAMLMSKGLAAFKGVQENESRTTDMLIAGCAVGVACSFASPIGGVLLSIEVTSVYFVVGNFWRGFFAAICSAMMFRLLAVWTHEEETLTALYNTDYKVDYKFDPQELFAFALVGILSGFVGALFVFTHRCYVMFMRKNKKMKAFLQKSRLLYPFVVSLIISTANFPCGTGQFMAGHLDTHHQFKDLFSNITWTKEVHSVKEFEVVDNWRSPLGGGVVVTLVGYVIYNFFGTIIASTLPIPLGLFIPVFKVGAGLGRLIGEGMACLFPNGMRYGGSNHVIIPGGYAIVGAAALGGAVTHTISTAVILCELTGQITHVLPVMLAVIIANAIAKLLQPSIYDNITKIKKLPYLPDILTATFGAYDIFVEDFMIQDVSYVWHGITFGQLRDILNQHKRIRALPLVDSPDSMILLGSITRSELNTLIEQILGRDRRQRVFNRLRLASQKALEAEQLEIEAENAKAEAEKMNSLPVVTGTEGDESPDISPAPTPASTVPTTSAAVESLTTTTSAAVESLTTTTSASGESLTTSGIPEGVDLSQRRPSRFEVVKIDTPAKQRSTVSLEMDLEGPVQPGSPSHRPVDAALRSLLPKSILKKTSSVILQPVPPSPTAFSRHEQLKQAFDAVVKKSSLLRMDDRGSQNLDSPTKVPFPVARMIEMTLEEQKRWEEEELNREVDFGQCHIDPAPFQLVERTSLAKVHSIFAMLRLNHAYVTTLGRLIGVVALKELRKAIEEANSGDFPKPEPPPPTGVATDEAREPLNRPAANEEKD
ncbi:chloride channel protein 2-like isoform X2 [Macrobrachium nipponense]|uniref:chloride channel protein 2-like isoform X2 n=1 Tax=Macrobrachium nipponense TaxID=159736 RepID=UPI0030C89BDC